MSMYPHPIAPIPAETAQLAWKINPKGTLIMRLRDRLGSLYQDEDFVGLYPATGQPAFDPWRLALVVVFEYVEGLTDRQAAEAVRNRIDWKYALSLELTDVGFDASILSEFRQRLTEHQQAAVLLEKLVQMGQQEGWIRSNSKVRTDSTHILAKVRRLNQLELVGETLRATLDALSDAAPAWVHGHLPAEWGMRYGLLINERRLPNSEAERERWAKQVGADGFVLLHLLQEPQTPAALRQLGQVQTLQTVWQQCYQRDEQGRVKWRDGPRVEAKERLISPYETDARVGCKGNQTWLGYRTHVTETCEADLPEVIVQVQTTPAPINDVEQLQPIQQQVLKQGLRPREHLVDGGYLNSEQMLASAQLGIEVHGPALSDQSWQARAPGGYTLKAFEVDWQQQTVRCPQGQQSQSWQVAKRGKQAGSITVLFERTTCASCPVRGHCTRSQKQGRKLSLPPQERAELLAHNRPQATDDAYQRQYALRSGVEACISQSVRRLGSRQARSRGEPAVQLQQVLCAVALNFIRLDAWWQRRKRGKLRRGSFGRLMAA
jgi:transposase